MKSELNSRFKKQFKHHKTEESLESVNNESKFDKYLCLFIRLFPACLSRC